MIEGSSQTQLSLKTTGDQVLNKIRDFIDVFNNGMKI
jgi:hypothetical protein